TPYEITTFRVDGEYSDSRRPDSVCFTASIEEDLARRDFTMNAIAMDISGKIIDPYGGAEDIKNHVIRCVGEPERRFKEDALRIMRAVRFASQLGFTIDEKTADSVHSMAGSLDSISRERIRDELDKLICGENCVDVLLEYSDVITAIIPEIAPCIGFEQRSDFHIYDVWEHIVRAVGAAPADNLRLRRSLLFHDISKPDCMTIDEQGKGHFKGHAELSAIETKKIMKRLRYDNKSITETSLLVHYHREKIRSKIEAKRLVSKVGAELFFELVELKKADNLAKRSFVLKENPKLDSAAEEARKFIRAGECCSLNQLAVNGGDLAEIGLKGRELGQTLNEILDLIIEEKLENSKTSIIKFLKER
ncbi:MAG: HD domain-containing protein, partial [Ruminococcus sp.]|nr:HD domain-containing protein [Ruminococcus sp.]